MIWCIHVGFNKIQNIYKAPQKECQVAGNRNLCLQSWCLVTLFEVWIGLFLWLAYIPWENLQVADVVAWSQTQSSLRVTPLVIIYGAHIQDQAILSNNFSHSKRSFCTTVGERWPRMSKQLIIISEKCTLSLLETYQSQGFWLHI